eukprot:Anaeramoba_ignava/a347521_145.p1 GENE.a347521_145~~a347521_145.p1  ORF type:complete len:2028 (+),score=590.97 a347521_145:39-6122(+)
MLSRKQKLLPPFLDFVLDKVYFRSITIIGFLLIASSLLFYFSFWVFKRPDDTTNEYGGAIDMVIIPSTQATYNQDLPQQPKIRIMDIDRKQGLSNQEVTIFAEFDDPMIQIQNHSENLHTIEWLRILPQYQPILTGILTAYGDEDGLVSFENISFAKGYHGNYRYVFSARDLSITSDFTTFLYGETGKINLESFQPEEYDMDISPQINATLTLFNENGEFSEGRYVSLLVDDISTAQYPDKKFAIFENDIFGPSNESGVIVVQTKILGTISDHLFLSFNWDGLSKTWYDSLQENLTSSPIKIISSVDSVQIVTQPPSNLVESTFMNPQPRVQVLNSLGEGIANKIVFAQITTYLDQNAPNLYLPTKINESAKDIFNVVSETTDSQGYASFSRLGFTQAGETDSSKSFRISFICDGVFSNESNDIHLQSSVQKISIMNINQSFKFTPINNSDLSSEIDPIPQISVVNENSQGIWKKNVEILIVNQDGLIISNPPIILNQTNFITGINGIVQTPLKIIVSSQSGDFNFKLRFQVDNEFFVDTSLLTINTDTTNPNGTTCAFIEVPSSIFPNSTISGEPLSSFYIHVIDYLNQPVENFYISFEVEKHLITFEVPNNITTDSTGEASITNLVLTGSSMLTQLIIYAGSSPGAKECSSQTMVLIVDEKISNASIISQPNEIPVRQFSSDPFLISVKDSNDVGVDGIQSLIFISHAPDYVIDSEEVIIATNLSINYLNVDNYETMIPPSFLENYDIQSQFYGVKSLNLTNSSGIASLENDFLFRFPGIYEYFIMTNGELTSFENHTINISNSEVDEIVITFQEDHHLESNAIIINTNLDPLFSIKIQDSGASPLENYRIKVNATLLNPPTAEQFYIAMYSSADDDGLCRGGRISPCAYSLPSNSSGYVSFDELRIFEIYSDSGTTITTANVLFTFIFAEGEEFEKTVVSQNVWFENEVAYIDIQSYPSSYVSLNSYFPQIGIVQIMDISRDPLAYYDIDIRFLSSPNNYTYDFSYKPGVSKTNGWTILEDLIFESGTAGNYELVFTSYGVRSDSVNITLSTTPSQLKLNDLTNYYQENYETIKIQVQQITPVPRLVSVLTLDGAYIVDKKVSAKITNVYLWNETTNSLEEQNLSDFPCELDPLSVQQTSTNGTAIFDTLIFTYCTPANYTITYYCDDVSQEDQRLFEVSTTVSQIYILQQPQSTVYLDKPLVQYPYIKVVDSIGNPVPNHRIIFKADYDLSYQETYGFRLSLNDSLQNEYDTFNHQQSLLTDSDGEFSCENLIFYGYRSGDCRLCFEVDGVNVTSNLIHVEVGEIDFKYEDNWKTLTIFTIISLVVIMWFNHFYFHKIFIFINFVITIIPLFFIVAAKDKMTAYKPTNPINAYTIILFVLLCVFQAILMFILLYGMILIFSKKKGWEFYRTKITNYNLLVKRLLPLGTKNSKKIVKEKKKKRRRTRNKKQNIMKDNIQIDELELEDIPPPIIEPPPLPPRLPNNDNINFPPPLPPRSQKDNVNFPPPLPPRLPKDIDNLPPPIIKPPLPPRKTHHFEDESEKTSESETSITDSENEYEKKKYNNQSESNGKKIRNSIKKYFDSKYKAAKKGFLGLFVYRPKSEHRAFETTKDFYFPQRLLIGAFMSIIFVTFLVMLLTLAIEWFNYIISDVREQIVTSTITLESTLTDINGALNDSNPSVNELNTYLDTITLPGEALGVPKSAVTELQNSITVAASISSAFNLFVVILMWWFVMRLFRSRIMRARFGNWFFKFSDNPNFNPNMTKSVVQSIRYIGFQTGHTLVGFIFNWVFCTLILWLIAYRPVRVWLFKKLIVWLLGLVVGSWIARQILKKVFRRFFISGKLVVVHGRWFSLFEFLWIFLNVVPSLVISFIRLIIVLFGASFFFMRIDMGMEKLTRISDSGFLSYFSMFESDAIHNNPIVISFANQLLLQKTKESAQIIKDEKKEFKNRKARSTFLMLISMSNNRKMLKQRATFLKEEEERKNNLHLEDIENQNKDKRNKKNQKRKDVQEISLSSNDDKKQK